MNRRIHFTWSGNSYENSAGEDPKQYGREDRRDICYSITSYYLGKIKPRKILCCCCRFDVLLFLFVLCRYAHYKNNTANFLEYSLECNTTWQIWYNIVSNSLYIKEKIVMSCIVSIEKPQAERLRSLKTIDRSNDIWNNIVVR